MPVAIRVTKTYDSELNSDIFKKKQLKLLLGNGHDTQLRENSI